MLSISLSKLATLKIKLDTIEELYKDEQKRVIEQLRTEKDKCGKDPDLPILAKLITTQRRDFNPVGVKMVLGEKAKLCIEEKVNASKFDALAKNKGEYALTTEEQKKCFSLTSIDRLDLDGLDILRNELDKKLAEKNNATNGD
jgi:hypothetical protein